MRPISIIVSICLLTFPPLGAHLADGGEKPHRLLPRPARPNVEAPAVYTLAEVTVVGSPRPIVAPVPVPPKEWSCSGWRDSLVGGSYRECGWK